MPLAVTHVLLTIIAVDLYRDFVTKHKKYFSLHTVLVAGIGGLLPDVDIPLSWLLGLVGYQIGLLGHGGVTHTPFFGLLFLLPAFYYLRQGKHKTGMYFFVISFGVLFHIFLDFLLGGGDPSGIMVFWPLATDGYRIHLLNRVGVSHLPAAVDALILLAWLYREETKHKIRDFI